MLLRFKVKLHFVTSADRRTTTLYRILDNDVFCISGNCMSEFMGLILGRYEAKVCIHHEGVLFRALPDEVGGGPIVITLSICLPIPLSISPSVCLSVCLS